MRNYCWLGNTWNVSMYFTSSDCNSQVQEPTTPKKYVISRSHKQQWVLFQHPPKAYCQQTIKMSEEWHTQNKRTSHSPCGFISIVTYGKLPRTAITSSYFLSSRKWSKLRRSEPFKLTKSWILLILYWSKERRKEDPW